jgi:hypothetical protein
MRNESILKPWNGDYHRLKLRLDNVCLEWKKEKLAFN